MQGTEILRIADLSSMEVLVEINENDIVNVNLQDSSRIEVDAFPDDIFFGKVTEIAYSATSSITGNDQVTSFEVKVKISPSSYSREKTAMLVSNSELTVNESPFRPGMTALVDIYTEWEKGAITVPIQSVTLAKDDDEDKDKDEEKDKDEKPQEVVFAVNNNLAREIKIETGISDDNYIVVKSGLKEGEEVVIGPYTTLTKTLTDSTAVTIDKGRDDEKKPWRR
jgi:HlyD family secretion protein